MRSILSARAGRGVHALLRGAACAALLLAAAACRDGGTPPEPKNPTPAISSVDPARLLQWSDSAAVTVTGSGFVNGVVARLDGGARLTTYVSPSQLTFVVPADRMQQAGSLNLTVVNPAPGGGESGAMVLPVEHRVPELQFLEPAGAQQGGAAFVLSVTGAGFSQGSVVRWNGADRPTTFVNRGLVTAQIPATDLGQVGTAQVAVFNPAPGGGASAPRVFTVSARPNPVPQLTELSPGTIVAGTGATFTVTGTGFVTGAQVFVGGFSPTTTVVSPTEVRFTLQGSNLPNPGMAQIYVRNPQPGGGNSNPLQLTVTSPAPTLTALSPAEAAVQQENLAVRLTGTGFMVNSSVLVNNQPRPAQRIGATEMEVVLFSYEVSQPGTFSFRVSTPQPGGGLSAPLTLTIANPAPVAQSLSPAQSQAGQDSLVVRVTGTGFIRSSVVRVGGSARTTRYVSATALDVVLQAEDLDEAGTLAITVSTPQPGGGTSAPLNLTLTASAPVLTGLPSYGASAGRPGFPLMVHGSGFLASSVVRWNGVARETRFVSSTRLEVSVSDQDVASPGAASITVHTPGAGTSEALQLTIRAPGAVSVLDLQVLELPAADLVYDAARDRIYASITSGTHANTVVRINPATGAVEGSVGVGSGPGKLALSSDGNTLWVGLNGSSQVRRVALPAFTAGAAFSTGSIRPTELHAMPGQPGTVVVVREGTITVYDDGVARPGSAGSNSVAFGESASVMYGHNNHSSEFGLRTFRVDAQGIHETRVDYAVIGGYYTRILFSAGRLYGSSGIVADAARRERVGAFDAGINPSSWTVDTQLGRAYFMGSGSGQLTVFDVNTFQEMGSVYVSSMYNEHPAAANERLIRWGTDGLAMNDGQRIYLFRTPVAAP